MVADRLRRLLTDLDAQAPKLIVVASLAGSSDGLTPPLPVACPVLPFDPGLAQAFALAGAAPVALVVGQHCARGTALAAYVRRARGARTVVVEEWPGLREGRIDEARVADLAERGVGAVALSCPHGAAAIPALAAAGIAAADGVAVTAARAVQLVQRTARLARRRRAGRRLLIATDTHAHMRERAT